jgi:hypothetical protein
VEDNSDVSDDETSEEEKIIPVKNRTLRRKQTFKEKQDNRGNKLLEVQMRLEMELKF